MSPITGSPVAAGLSIAGATSGFTAWAASHRPMHVVSSVPSARQAIMNCSLVCCSGDPAGVVNGVAVGSLVAIGVVVSIGGSVGAGGTVSSTGGSSVGVS